jgi:hypothetical protein
VDVPRDLPGPLLYQQELPALIVDHRLVGADDDL